MRVRNVYYHQPSSRDFKHIFRKFVAVASRGTDETTALMSRVLLQWTQKDTRMLEKNKK